MYYNSLRLLSFTFQSNLREVSDSYYLLQHRVGVKTVMKRSYM